MKSSGVLFEKGDNSWSRNFKRGIISTFQVKSFDSLRAYNLTAGNDQEMKYNKGSVVSESDVLGKCRTVYSTNYLDRESENTFEIQKTKDLHTCQMSSNYLSNEDSHIKQVSIF